MAASRSYLDERRAARRWQAITGIVAACALAAAALWVLHQQSDTTAAGATPGATGRLGSAAAPVRPRSAKG